MPTSKGLWSSGTDSDNASSCGAFGVKVPLAGEMPAKRRRAVPTPRNHSVATYCCNEGVCKLQTLAAPRTTEKVIFKNRDLMFRQSTREVRVDRFIRIGWAAIKLHTLMLTDSGFLGKNQNIRFWTSTYRVFGSGNVLLQTGSKY